MPVNLFVDDLRVAPEGWIVARTITEAIKILATQKVEAVSLDHDIVYLDERGSYNGKVNAENYTAVARFIKEMDDEVKPKTVYVHTANPDGARAIFSILKGHVDTILRDPSFSHEWLDIDEPRAI